MGVYVAELRRNSRVVVYLDDILITGPPEQEHLDTLEAVLQKLQLGGWIKAAEGQMCFSGLFCHLSGLPD